MNARKAGEEGGWERLGLRWLRGGSAVRSGSVMWASSHGPQASVGSTRSRHTVRWASCPPASESISIRTRTCPTVPSTPPSSWPRHGTPGSTSWPSPTTTPGTVGGRPRTPSSTPGRSEEHTSELQSRGHLVCRLLLEKKKLKRNTRNDEEVRQAIMRRQHADTK